MKQELLAAQRIEESHGLWECCVIRLATLAEVGAGRHLITEAAKAERDAFKNWQRISREAGA